MDRLLRGRSGFAVVRKKEAAIAAEWVASGDAVAGEEDDDAVVFVYGL